MGIIGREREIDTLFRCVESKRPELLIVYGRRRVGKTFLIREYFNDRFSFYSTGIPDEKTRNQLKAFNECLMNYGDAVKTIPADWFESFRRLRALLEDERVIRDPVSGKRVVFLDEVPWMDTARSDFKSAFDFFWNSWGAAQNDLLLIVCGSATSWIINNMLRDKGGFHNRVTKRLYLESFTLRECEAYFAGNGVQLSRDQIMESYMIFGGIPYYLNLYDNRMSLAQNVDTLIFDERGDLHDEYDLLFRSLFKKADTHRKIIEVMVERRAGIQRVDLANRSGITDGEGLTKALRELVQCGFVRKYANLTTEKKGCFYQITDPFVLFVLNIINKRNLRSWQSFIKSPDYHAWRGNAFEILCLNHIDQIKTALGISGIDSAEYSWRSRLKEGGTQIDLLIDRRDDVINLCEMKCTDKEFVIDKNYRKELLNKAEVFRMETGSKKSIHITMITSNGLRRNENTGIVQNIIEPEKLFC